MKKTIIVLYGRQNEGKSHTLKTVCSTLLSTYPQAVPSEQPNYRGDILVNIDIDEIRIGIESEGDPNGRLVRDNTLSRLADKKLDPSLGDCDIILCATRTRGKTVRVIEDIADTYDYHTIWLSSFFGPEHNHFVLNDIAAKSIMNIIKALMDDVI